MHTQAAQEADAASAEREKQLQDHITAGIIEAGIVKCVKSQPVGS